MSDLKATKRESLSSGSNNKLRAKGLIPAILYGGKNTNEKISIAKKDLKNVKHHLYGFKSVKNNYSTGNWLKDAKLKIDNIKKKNNNINFNYHNSDDLLIQ